ncbi:MAG: hypothetical protein GY754_15280, partial [bacterium]|nr:hypothetical protein [bacterium]
ASDITLDNSGNIYLTGRSAGDLDGNTNSGLTDIFLAKFKPSGEKEWVQLMGSDQDEMAEAIAVDSSGNSYITGRSAGTLWGYIPIASYDYFLAKCDTAGERIWSHHLGNASGDYGADIIVDANNIIHVTGYVEGGINGVSGNGMWDAFLLKYDGVGALNSTAISGGSEKDYAFGIAADSTGNIYMAGNGASDLYGTSAGGHDILLTKVYYSTDPVTVWGRQTGLSGDEWSYAVAVDNDDNIYICGLTNSTLDGSNHIFLLKYSSSGDTLWSRVVGSGSNDIGKGVAVDSDNNVYVTGQTAGDLDGNINSGGNDIFIMKYSSSGVKQWIKQVGTPYDETANKIAINKNENSEDDIYITGSSDGNLDGKTNSNEGVSGDIFIMKFNTSGEVQ